MKIMMLILTLMTLTMMLRGEEVDVVDVVDVYDVDAEGRREVGGGVSRSPPKASTALSPTH